MNKDLAAYLGRNEIQLTVKDTGYQITQNGEVADALSEGEKTAIAFLYFLKSLNDKNFNLGKGIVVIDDPVSSLDSNAMFYAFGFMKERTSNVGQLFILTHNFAFFRQVKNWFSYVNKRKKKLKKESGFYMLECTCDQSGRNARITALDKLLVNYESEYHYLFSLVVQGANSTSNNCELESRYHYPNIARRVLEAFLAFRKPKEAGELKQQMDALSFNVEKKTKILRFVHTHSHYEHIGDPEHDISILSETPAVLHDLIELIKSEDTKHFDEMSGLVNNVNETEEIK